MLEHEEPTNERYEEIEMDEFLTQCQDVDVELVQKAASNVMTFTFMDGMKYQLWAESSYLAGGHFQVSKWVDNDQTE